MGCSSMVVKVQGAPVVVRGYGGGPWGGMGESDLLLGSRGVMMTGFPWRGMTTLGIITS